MKRLTDSSVTRQTSIGSSFFHGSISGLVSGLLLQPFDVRFFDFYFFWGAGGEAEFFGRQVVKTRQQGMICSLRSVTSQ